MPASLKEWFNNTPFSINDRIKMKGEKKLYQIERWDFEIVNWRLYEELKNWIQMGRKKWWKKKKGKNGGVVEVEDEEEDLRSFKHRYNFCSQQKLFCFLSLQKMCNRFT